MKVRGSVIRSINEFVASQHDGKYKEWIGQLPAESRELLTKASNSGWYSIHDGVIAPTEVMCNMLYGDTKAGAWESGRYSAKTALTGLYKIFVLVATPAFMIKRASRVIATYYEPTQLEVVEDQPKSMVLRCTQLPVKSELIEYRIAGWMEQALEICGCKNLKVNITKSFSKSDSFVVDIQWD